MVFAADILIAALLVTGIWGVDYLLPQKGIQAQTALASASSGKSSSGSLKQEEESAAQDTEKKAVQSKAGDSQREAALQQLVDGNARGLKTTKVKLDSQDWHKKFADKFTSKVKSTDTSYTNPDLSVELSYHSYQSDRLDTTGNGNHRKYGKGISYVIADIYVGDITCLQTCFAQDTYGVGYTEMMTSMSSRMKSVLGVNGDSYSNSRHADNGTIIRNGVIYRAKSTDMETCVLNWDGTMKIYSPQELNTQQLIEEGAYQSWIFGPSLLDDQGKAKDSFLTWSYIRESHPRTAIGYYEPGHYCLVVVDGRQSTTRGMFLEELAKVFQDLGCKAAYNLDGGHCSFMTMGNNIANHPYRPEHQVEAGIFITDLVNPSSITASGASSWNI